MATVNMHEAKTQLSRLVERAKRGEDIVIAKNGQPVARLVPIEDRLKPRVAGSMRGQIWIADDFDAPLPPELLACFTGEK
jgi:prevent-host-death family protein